MVATEEPATTDDVNVFSYKFSDLYVTFRSLLISQLDHNLSSIAVCHSKKAMEDYETE